jgi:hypothetical protein
MGFGFLPRKSQGNGKRLAGSALRPNGIPRREMPSRSLHFRRSIELF